MKTVLDLCRRNLKLFFRDRMNVFFALLSSLILFAIFAMFLSKLQADGIARTFENLNTKDINGFVQSWVFAGITMVTTVTAGMGALTIFVDDRASGRFKDFLVSPIKRWQLVLGYLLSTYVVSVTLTTVVLIVGQVYMCLSGFTTMDISQLTIAYFYILIFAAVFSAIASFVASFIKTTGAYSSLNTIVGTVLGFFAAIYLPLGNLPSGVANFLSALPFAQAAAIIRQPYTSHYMNVLSGGNSEITDKLTIIYGNAITIGSKDISNAYILGFFIVLTIVFFVLSSWRMGRKIQQS